MIEILNLTIRVPELLLYLIDCFFKGIFWLFVLLFVLGLLQRVFGWIGRIRGKWDRTYFPFDWKICQQVFDNQPSWWKKAGEFLKSWPYNASVVGFFCALMWPCLIFLNLFLLAQILELFFSGGQRITFPLVGIYSTFPLIMGALFAFIQTLLGILHGHSKSKGAKIAYVLVGLLMILAEGGLAAYRAWLLSTGEEPISPTLVDVLMVKGGIVLGGLLGVFVPLGEILAGRFAFLQFIESIVETSLRWFAGLMIPIWGIAVWWVCGFYPERPEKPKPVERILPKPPSVLPKWIADLDTDINQLKDKVSKLNEDSKRLRKQTVLSERLDEIREFNDLRQKVDELKKRVENKGWDKNIKEIVQEIDEVEGLNSLKQISQKILRISNEIKVIIPKIELYESEIVKFSQLDEWKRVVEQFKNGFEQQLNEIVTSLENLNPLPLRTAAETLRAILQEQPIPQSTMITPVEIAQVQKFIADAKIDVEDNPTLRDKKDNAEKILDECRQLSHKALNIALLEIETNLKTINESLKKLKEDFDRYIKEISSPSAMPYKEIEQELLNIDSSITEFKRLQRKCRFKKLFLYLSPWNWRK